MHAIVLLAGEVIHSGKDLSPLQSLLREEKNLTFHSFTEGFGMRVRLFLVNYALGIAAVTAFGQGEVRFTEVTQSVGIRFVHNNGAFGKKYLPETMGGGLCIFDANNDGLLDIFFANGMDWKGHPTGKSNLSALYIQQPNGKFVDHARAAGLTTPMYAMGSVAADYDNDGDADLYISCLGEDRLYQNDGKGRFTDVTRKAGMSNPGFSSSAAWLDYDRDGFLDLYVCNYVEWTPETDLFCTVDGITKAYCTPESYKGSPDRLFRNNGNGTFTDVTHKAGTIAPNSKSLGVIAFDYNEDGWIDIFVANDTEPNLLWENQGNGTFEDVAMIAGVGFDDAGVARAGMGVDIGDYDRSGRFSLVITNFSNQMISLYDNEGNGLFIDSAPQTGVGSASLLTLGFGCFFFDANNDGWQDVFVANGHVENEINRVQKNVFYAQYPHLFLNNGGKRFQDVAKKAGFSRPLVGRGAAYADFDNDGDLDVVMTTSGGEAHFWRNDTPFQNALRIRVRGDGVRSNRDGIGTVVRVKSRDGVQKQVVRAGSSYCSQSELTLTFGLGNESVATEVEVLYPSGKRQTFQNVRANQTVEIVEGKGIVASRPFRRSK